MSPTYFGFTGQFHRGFFRRRMLPNSKSLYWFPVGHPPFVCRIAEPTFLRRSASSHCRGRPKRQGQQRGNCNSTQFQMRTLRYSLRRVSPLDSVNGGTHNPTIAGHQKLFRFTTDARCSQPKPSPRQARLSRPLKDLRSHVRDAEPLQILLNVR